MADGSSKRSQFGLSSESSHSSSTESELENANLSTSDEELVQKHLEEVDRRRAAGEIPASQPRNSSSDSDSDHSSIPLPPEIEESDPEENIEERMREAKRIHGTNMDFSLIVPTKKQKQKPKVSKWALPEREVPAQNFPKRVERRSQANPAIMSPTRSQENNENVRVKARPSSSFRHQGGIDETQSDGNEGGDETDEEEEIFPSSAPISGKSSTPMVKANQLSSLSHLAISPVPNAVDMNHEIMTTKRPERVASRIPNPSQHILTPSHLRLSMRGGLSVPISDSNGSSVIKQPPPFTANYSRIQDSGAQQSSDDDETEPEPTAAAKFKSIPAQFEHGQNNFSTPAPVQTQRRSNKGESKSPRTQKDKNIPQSTIHQTQPSTSTQRSQVPQIKSIEVQDNEDNERSESEPDESDSDKDSEESSYESSQDEQLQSTIPVTRKSTTVTQVPVRPSFAGRNIRQSSVSQKDNNLRPASLSKTHAKHKTPEVQAVSQSPRRTPIEASTTMSQTDAAQADGQTTTADSAEKAGPVPYTGEQSSLFSNKSGANDQLSLNGSHHSRKPAPKSVQERRLAEQSAITSTAPSARKSFAPVSAHGLQQSRKDTDNDDEALDYSTGTSNAEQTFSSGNKALPVPTSVSVKTTEISSRKKPMLKSVADRLSQASTTIVTRAQVERAIEASITIREPEPNSGEAASPLRTRNGNTLNQSEFLFLTRSHISSEGNSQSSRTSKASGLPKKSEKSKLPNVNVQPGPSVTKRASGAEAKSAKTPTKPASKKQNSQIPRSQIPVAVNSLEPVQRTSQHHNQQQSAPTKATRGSKEVPINLEEEQNDEMSAPKQRRTTRAAKRKQSNQPTDVIEPSSSKTKQKTKQHAPAGKTNLSDVDPRPNAEPESVKSGKGTRKSPRKKGATNIESEPVIPEVETAADNSRKRKSKAGPPIELVRGARASKRLKARDSSAPSAPTEEARNDHPVENLDDIFEDEEIAEEVEAELLVDPDPNEDVEVATSSKPDSRQKTLRKKISVKAPSAVLPTKTSRKKKASQSQQRTSTRQIQSPSAELPVPGSLAEAGTSRNSAAAQAFDVSDNQSHIRRLTFSPNLENKNASRTSVGQPPSAISSANQSRLPSFNVKKKRISISQTRRVPPKSSSQQSSLVPPSQVQGPSRSQVSYFSTTHRPSASALSTSSSKKQRKKRETTPVRYTGTDVFGNYHMMSVKQVKELLDTERPDHGYRDSQVRKIALKINHFLEDFFEHLCKNTNQAHGFVPFDQLMDLMIQQHLLPQNSTPEDLMQDMKNRFSPEDWKATEGVLYPHRKSKTCNNDDYFLQ